MLAPAGDRSHIAILPSPLRHPSFPKASTKMYAFPKRTVFRERETYSSSKKRTLLIIQRGKLKLWTLKDDLASCHVILVITIKITPSERFFSILFTASYPKASPSMKICAQRKAGRRKRTRRRFASPLSPFHGALRFVTSHSRYALASRVAKGSEEAGRGSTVRVKFSERLTLHSL